jgi:hypothetical protein
MGQWLGGRKQAGFAEPTRTWCHRPYKNITNDTRDWGGSSGLLMVKIARELHFKHIILCGIPMTVEAGHIVRKVQWNAAHGFRRGWMRHLHELKPFVRSYAGWTFELFGRPDREWLQRDIADPRPPQQEHEQIKA